jgi:hypothetical protein
MNPEATSSFVSTTRTRGVIPWLCRCCGEDRVVFGKLPEDLLCHTCRDAQPVAFSGGGLITSQLLPELLGYRQQGRARG